MPLTRSSVLVVDDSLTIRVGLGNTFAEAGFLVELAAGIREAEELLLRSPFALVVLDLNLPDGDAMYFLQRLTTGHYARPIPVMVISGAETLAARLGALKCGADFVAKPYHRGFVIERARLLADLAAIEESGDRPCRVLVIDDSPTYGNAVMAELQKRGHDVVLAPTAADGFAYLALQKPDRVLVDVFLPDADGIDVARRIRELAIGREMPVLLLTGRESATTRKRAIQAGVTAFLTKDSPLAAVGAWVWHPTRSGLDGPSQSGVYGSVASSRDAAPAPIESGDLFERVLTASGMSLVLGRSTIGLALRRCGVDTESLTPEGLARCLEQIEKTLGTFLPPETVGARISAIARLAGENHHAITAK